jgi:hypothetical protein
LHNFQMKLRIISQEVRDANNDIPVAPPPPPSTHNNSYTNMSNTETYQRTTLNERTFSPNVYEDNMYFYNYNHFS